MQCNYPKTGTFTYTRTLSSRRCKRCTKVNQYSRLLGRFHDLYFVAKNENKPSQGIAAVDWVRFNFLRAQ